MIPQHIMQTYHITCHWSYYFTCCRKSICFCTELSIFPIIFIESARTGDRQWLFLSMSVSALYCISSVYITLHMSLLLLPQHCRCL